MYLLGHELSLLYFYPLHEVNLYWTLFFTHMKEKYKGT